MNRPVCFRFFVEAESDNFAWVGDLDGIPYGCDSLEQARERIRESAARGEAWKRRYRVVSRAGETVETVDLRPSSQTGAGAAGRGKKSGGSRP